MNGPQISLIGNTFYWSSMTNTAKNPQINNIGAIRQGLLTLKVLLSISLAAFSCFYEKPRTLNEEYLCNACVVTDLIRRAAQLPKIPLKCFRILNYLAEEQLTAKELKLLVSQVNRNCPDTECSQQRSQGCGNWLTAGCVFLGTRWDSYGTGWAEGTFEGYERFII